MRAILTIFIILLTTLSCYAQEMTVKSRLNVIRKNWSKPNSSNQEDLKTNLSRMVPGAFNLSPGTKLNIVRSHSYVMRVTRPVRSSMKTEKWDYEAAYIEVLDGPNQGEKGWAVVKRKRKKSRSWQTYIGAASSGNGRRRARNSASSSVPKGDPNAPDLQLRVSRGSREMAGKAVYAVNFQNMGKSETRGKIVVVVKVEGKVIKTHRHSGRLKPRGAGYFNFEVSESKARKHKPYVVTVDPDNKIEEYDENNNVVKGKL